jgi:neutral ceramidase
MTASRALVSLLRMCLLVLGVALAPACTPKMPGAWAPGPPPPGPATAGEFRVGTARVDITPPPGVTTFGHGPDALVSNGVWSRIYCRVFVLIGTAGPVAVIPCDLAATSTLLQRSIAARVSDLLPTSRIFLSATHTHAGPAHYFDGDSFDGAFSTHVPGFDKNMVGFLANRVATGVREAFASARPATVQSWHYDSGEAACGPDGNRRGTWGITWNRSLGAHSAGAAMPPNAPPELCEVEKAIDPAMHVVRFAEKGADEAHQRPIGVLVYFAMHPTVLPNTNTLLGADVDGALSRILEHDMQREWNAVDRSNLPALPHDPLAGIVNTNEGDISPVWTRGTKEEALDVATELKVRIDDLMGSVGYAPKCSAVIDARYVEAGLPNAKTYETPAPQRVCATAEVGQSVPFGACDHPATSTSGIPAATASEDETCQFPKETPGGLLENIFGGGRFFFPETVPLGLVRIDDTLIGVVPAELTMSAGKRVNDEVLRRFHAEAGSMHAVISGLSNGYILYVTTPAEYNYVGTGGGCAVVTDGLTRQSYEAASTVYGPRTLELLVERLGWLADSMAVGTIHDFPQMDHATTFHYDTAGPSRGRFPMPTCSKVAPTEISTCWLPEDHSFCFEWKDGGPGDVGITDAPWVYLANHDTPERREVRACPLSDSHCDFFDTIDDRGTSFVTRALKQDAGGMDWVTLWHPAPGEWDAIREAGVHAVAIRVRSRDGNGVESEPIASMGGSKVCDTTQAEACGVFDRPANSLPIPCSCVPKSPSCVPVPTKPR